MKKSHLILLVILIVNLLDISPAASQVSTYHQKTMRFELNLNKLMNMAYRVRRGNSVMEYEGKVKNEAHVFGFAIYVNKMGIADSIVFTNKTPLLDSIVSFGRIEESIKKDKIIFQEYKNSVIVSMGFVSRSWDKTITNVPSFIDQLFNVIPKLYLNDKTLHIIGPISFIGMLAVAD